MQIMSTLWVISVTIEKLERVLWRVRKRNPKTDRPTWLELRRAIMYEIGTSEWAYNHNKKALLRLNWIRVHNKSRFRLTNIDLEES